MSAPYAKILNSNDIVEDVAINSSMPVQAGFTFVDVTSITCTDNSPVVAGCTYDGTNFTSVPPDNFGRVVTMSSDGVNDTYTVTDQIAENSFDVVVAVGTSHADAYAQINATQVPSLADTLAWKEEQFTAAVQSFIQGKFDLQTQLNFLAMTLQAQLQGLANRASYLAPLVSWRNAVIGYSATYLSALNAKASAADVVALQWDFSGIVAAPNVTLAGAVQISN